MQSKNHPSVQSRGYAPNYPSGAGGAGGNGCAGGNAGSSGAGGGHPYSVIVGGGGGGGYFSSPSHGQYSGNLTTAPVNAPYYIEPIDLKFVHEGKHIFTIKPDGSIEKGEFFTTKDEMAMAFWETIQECFHVWWWKELCKRR